ncbi:energy transducer TonB [Qipengyuania sediminis]|uniref:energy transducer TonB n=1 Tax=Qipengyuania sediminis TaxID=1532023 RepID=UPI001059A03A|nr:energy transducer TonB [Qipengyuania sediminis]
MVTSIRQAPARLVAVAIAASAASSAGAQAVAPPPAKLRPPAVSTPRAIDAGSWIRQDDYPASAVRDGEGGIVAFRLDVDAAGRVANCAILESSGPLVLAETTCRLLSERARFEPARDAAGRAIASRYHSRVRWEAPEDPPPPLPEAGEAIVTATIAPDGTVSDCTIEGGGGPRSEFAEECEELRFAPQPGPYAKPRRLRYTVRVEYLGPPK